MTTLTPAQVQSAEQRAKHESYLHQVLVAFDQFWNVAGSPLFVQEKGLPDETISAHVRRDVDQHKHKLLAVVLNHCLNVIQPNHGALAEAGDLARAQVISSTETSALNEPSSPSK